MSTAQPEGTPDHVEKKSRTEEVLLEGRRDLWKVALPFYLDPWREFWVSPTLRIWTIVLPPFANYIKADKFIASTVYYTTLTPMRFVLRCAAKKDAEEANMRGNAARSLLHPAAGLPKFKPPSDFISAVRGGFAFVFSAAADLVGAFINPKKMKKWLASIAQFRAYLHSSGVGAELEESMYKPFVRGRLLDNIKMLHDIQLMQDKERVEAARDETLSNEMNLKPAAAYMRYATAAYGAEIIKSAIDKDINVMDLENERKAIAFHTGLASPDDIKLLKIQEGGDMTTLRHYVAVDRNRKAIVLALRGTLSISGALVDMQAMDCSFCTGRAHQGISEMADAVWTESGEFLVNLVNEPDYKGYDFVITGHSLGGGTACLLHVKMYVEELLPATTTVYCYGFAPPPTFCYDKDSDCPKIEQAIKHCYGYIHDNDCVPHLSVATIRRLSTLMDTVDNFNEHVWFWERGLIFWGWKELPEDLISNVRTAQEEMKKLKCKDCEMIIPAKVVVWAKKNLKTNTFEAIPSSPHNIACQDILMSDDMVTDHLPEQYEDALDSMLAAAADEFVEVIGEVKKDI